MDNLQDELKDLKGFIAELKADRAATKEKEKRESWTKYVSLTVVVIAVLGSMAAQWSGKYGSRVQISQAQASDAWNLYQARSVKGHLLEVTTNTLAKSPNAGEPAIQALIQSYGRDVAKYEQGKAESKILAEAFESDRDASAELGSKLGPSLPIFSVSIALASMCLLTKKKPLWLVAILLAAIATATMISARLAETPPKGPALLRASQANKPPPQEKRAGLN